MLNRIVILKDMAKEPAKTWTLLLDENPPVYFHDLKVILKHLEDLHKNGECVA